MIRGQARRFRFDGTFAISRGARTHVDVVEVQVTRDGITGRGECVPYPRYGETVAGVLAQVAALPEGIGRAAVQEALPAGAARNGVDCALWDWEAKAAGRPAWQLAELPAPRAVPTAFTLSLDTPEAMAAKAAANAHRGTLKVKLGTPDDLPRLRAVRAGAPGARLIVDANEGWDLAAWQAIAPALAALGVALVEQPLPAAADEALRGQPRQVALCADESCHDRGTVPRLAGLYDMVNVKLDKTGGLTEAIATVAAARAAGLRVMLGCMAASSLAMAPALLLAPLADVIDLDGPLLLAEDRDHPIVYDAAGAHPPAPELWG